MKTTPLRAATGILPARPPLRIGVIEAEPAFREQLLDWIGGTPGFVIAGDYSCAEAALCEIPGHPPDVVLTALHLPGIGGLECLRRLRIVSPKLHAVVLTTFEDIEHIVAALEAGASAYLTKSATATELRTAIERVVRGGGMLSDGVASRLIAYFNARGRRRDDTPRLAPREQDVLDLLARGLSYKEVASRLQLSPHTVNDHVKSLYVRLHVHSRAEAVARFFHR